MISLLQGPLAPLYFVIDAMLFKEKAQLSPGAPHGEEMGGGLERLVLYSRFPTGGSLYHNSNMINTADYLPPFASVFIKQNAL